MECFEDLTCETYLTSVMRTANAGLLREDQVVNCCISLTEEFGELCGLIKKQHYHGHNISVEMFEKELGDTLFYLFWLCSLMEKEAPCVLFKYAFSVDFFSNQAIDPADLTRVNNATRVACRIVTAHKKLLELTDKVMRESIESSGHRVFEILALEYLNSLTSLCLDMGLNSRWGKIAAMNKAKLEKRYPGGFSKSASRNRKE